MSKKDTPPQQVAAPVFQPAAYPPAAASYAPPTTFPASGAFPMTGGFPAGYPPAANGMPGMLYVAVPAPTGVPASTGVHAPNLFYGQNPMTLGPAPVGHQLAGAIHARNPYVPKNYILAAW